MTLLDADATTANEHAILEPGVGETPLWDEVRSARCSRTTPMHCCCSPRWKPSIRRSTGRGHASARVEDQDWERAWMDQYVPLHFGARTWIVPWNQPLPDGAEAADAAVVRLDPGLAFGSGTHPTTSLCLQWLDATRRRRRTARRARARLRLRLGHPRAGRAEARRRATPSASTTTRRRCWPRTTTPSATASTSDWPCTCRDERAAARYPVVVANILASALDALADTLAARVAAGRRIALSGILAGQEDGIAGALCRLVRRLCSRARRRLGPHRRPSPRLNDRPARRV